MPERAVHQKGQIQYGTYGHSNSNSQSDTNVTSIANRPCLLFREGDEESKATWIMRTWVLREACSFGRAECHREVMCYDSRSPSSPTRHTCEEGSKLRSRGATAKASAEGVADPGPGAQTEIPYSLDTRDTVHCAIQRHGLWVMGPTGWPLSSALLACDSSIGQSLLINTHHPRPIKPAEA